jgi:hypothetical protein
MVFLLINPHAVSDVSKMTMPPVDEIVCSKFPNHSRKWGMCERPLGIPLCKTSNFSIS